MPPSDLQLIYAEEREHSSHHTAVREIARRIGVDPGTVKRCLNRAEKDHHQNFPRRQHPSPRH